jgi:hypothetical protein
LSIEKIITQNARIKITASNLILLKFFNRKKHNIKKIKSKTRALLSPEYKTNGKNNTKLIKKIKLHVKFFF